jgi:hypothetical protein
MSDAGKGTAVLRKRSLLVLALVAAAAGFVVGCGPQGKPPETARPAPVQPPPPARPVPPRESPAPNPSHHYEHIERGPASVPSDDEQLDQALATLKQGNLAYNTPTKMKTGQTARVVARIGSDQVSLTTLQSGMPSGQGTTTVTAPTPVSTKMKMALTSADFDITPLSSEEQFVAGTTPTT